MSLEETLQSFHISDQKLTQPYYFIQFENDIQIIFNEISRSKCVACVGINIIKGNVYLKGDYFIPLKSADAFQLNCDELLKKLKTISCVLDVEVDSNHNLTFRLKRSTVYKAALQEVSTHASKYGMARRIKCVLVLTNRLKSKSLDNLRNTLLAEHIISILAASDAKMFYTELEPDAISQLPNSTKLVCTDNCSLVDVCKHLEKKIHDSGWRTDSDIKDGICMDAKKYIEDNCLLSTYGNVLTSIVVSNDNTYEDLSKTAHIKHVIEEHMNCTPDVIIHIASQGQNRNTFKSGILLSMLEKCNPIQRYIFNQSVQYKGGMGKTADDFLKAHKLEIEKATATKYDTYVAENEMWISRVKSLVDAAVKFDFLKLNHSSVVNLRPPSCRDGEKNFGIFVQYNFARLSNLFRNFELKVEEGYYHPLLSLEKVDFSLLRLEEEWHLFYYVLSFPKLIVTILESLIPEENRKTSFRLNKICLMLQELCHYLSLYYSKIRILAGPQPHLQQVMNARLWLLKGIHQVFKNSFMLLNIQGLDQM